MAKMVSEQQITFKSEFYEDGIEQFRNNVHENTGTGKREKCKDSFKYSDLQYTWSAVIHLTQNQKTIRQQKKYLRKQS